MEHFINIPCDDTYEQSNSAKFKTETDPLEDLGAGTLDTKPSFIKINNIVFAEQLENTANEENSSEDNEDESEITIIDNVVVLKETGKKYKKYQYNIEDGSTLRCPQDNCLRTFQSKKRLTAHIRRVHCADPNKYICGLCGRGFKESHLLRRHAKSHSKSNLECPVCSMKLCSKNDFSSHLRSHSNEQPHKCDICKKTFANATNKASHIKFVHRDGPLECEMCDDRFSSRKEWNLHMKTHY